MNKGKLLIMLIVAAILLASGCGLEKAEKTSSEKKKSSEITELSNIQSNTNIQSDAEVTVSAESTAVPAYLKKY